MGYLAIRLAAWIGVRMISIGIAGALLLAAPLQSTADDLKISFKSPEVDPAQRVPGINYDLDLAQESFSAHVPPGYNSSSQRSGLIVFIYASDEDCAVPSGWASVLDRRGLVFISPLRAGNAQPLNRRRGLAVLGAMAALKQGKIDPQRVYVAGFSGGARVAGQVAIMQPGLFRGTIQNCGADFDRPMPPIADRPADRPAGDYGVEPELGRGMERARRNVMLTLITGARDFRHGDLLDIAAAYDKAGFQIKLIDVPGMGHGICAATTLNEALDYIDPDSRFAAEVPQSTSIGQGSTDEPARGFMAHNPLAWPQIVLGNDAHLKSGTTLQGGSAFLMRLPDDTIVAATARHVMDGVNLGRFASEVQAWSLVSPGGAHEKVELKKLAISPDAAESLDCLLMTVQRGGGYPAEILKARTTPAEEGETLYLATLASDGHAAQTIYKGVVRERLDRAHFTYEISGTVDTQGFSGAPILDAWGNVVGMHLGRLGSSSPVKGTLREALDIAQVVPAADAGGAGR